jgi:hypothetical protein
VAPRWTSQRLSSSGWRSLLPTALGVIPQETIMAVAMVIARGIIARYSA